MRRTITYIVAGLTVLMVVLFFAMRIWIGHSIKENITIAEKQYSGNAEDALIAYLNDTTNSPDDRSHIAIWTLGQMRSEKALPYLKELYNNDPEGRTCRGRHDMVLCQYEIHKAMVSIEHGWLGAKQKNWFGSWRRLNK